MGRNHDEMAGRTRGPFWAKCSDCGRDCERNRTPEGERIRCKKCTINAGATYLPVLSRQAKEMRVWAA